jgi:hypothetical protein
MTTPSLPFAAWEQAVFVALFIVLVIALLGWFSKQQSSWQKFMDDQNVRWQKSIDSMNNQWQTWLADQNTRECESMTKVTASVDRLTDKLAEHDGKVEDRFREAVAAIKPLARLKK